MTSYKWYQIFSLTEFEATGLVSREYQVNLQGIGLRSILVTKGNAVSIVYEDVLLSLNLGGNNPYEFGDYAIYLDSANLVWLGTPV
jgi:hypothetical protein